VKKSLYVMIAASVLALGTANLAAVCNNNADGHQHVKAMGKKKKTNVYVCATRPQSAYKGKMLTLMYDKNNNCARCGCSASEHVK